MFCKMKETQRSVGSPVNQPGGAPKSRKLHLGPQRPSEDSCEGLHHLSLKDNEVPFYGLLSSQSWKALAGTLLPRPSGRPAQAAAASAGTRR